MMIDYARSFIQNIEKKKGAPLRWKAAIVIKGKIVMIRLENIKLKNYKGFENAKIDFSPHLTCIAGVNGAGKTTLLDAAAKCLAWITGKIVPDTAKEHFISDSEITFSKATARIYSKVSYSSETVQFFITDKSFDGAAPVVYAIAKSKDTAFDSLQKAHNVLSPLPVLAYYTCNRSDLHINLAPPSIGIDLSDKYKVYDDALQEVSHFEDFFNWFRDREDRENEEIRKKYDAGDLKEKYSDKCLDAVRNAIKGFLPDYGGMKVRRNDGHIVLEKKRMLLDITSLSDGEKGIIVLLGDIARRLSMANPNSDNPLLGDGIVLIDEIELHLHPEWQRRIASKLVEIFPNCQFIITTHSPQVIGEVNAGDLRILDGGKVLGANQSLGLSSDEILDEVMNNDSENKTLVRNENVSNMLKELYDAVEKDDFEKAKTVIREIESKTNGPIHETRKMSAFIQMSED